MSTEERLAKLEQRFETLIKVIELHNESFKELGAALMNIEARFKALERK